MPRIEHVGDMVIPSLLPQDCERIRMYYKIKTLGRDFRYLNYY